MTPSSKKAVLVLEDGTVFEGSSFGYDSAAAGEVVFNTAMTGYPESLTDPSYRGQILVCTYPLVGNYGVPHDTRQNGMLQFFESERIQITGMVISDYSFEYSHWNAQQSLSQWLVTNKIPAMYGVDTRALTKLIREKGAMLGKIMVEGSSTDWYNPDAENLAAQVSTNEVITYGNGKKRIALIDCGVKNNIIRCFLKRDTTVVRVPWNYDLSKIQYDGLFISNGPGNPKMADATINQLKGAFEQDKPIFGICLGNQLMALAAGADTYKLKYGHRSHNQPVQMEGTSTCFVTSQNHGYAIDTKTLPSGWVPYFTNLNDQTCEGIKHTSKPFFSVQFHPEASGGPVDTEFLFDQFLNNIPNN